MWGPHELLFFLLFFCVCVVTSFVNLSSVDIKWEVGSKNSLLCFMLLMHGLQQFQCGICGHWFAIECLKNKRGGQNTLKKISNVESDKTNKICTVIPIAPKPQFPKPMSSELLVAAAILKSRCM